MQPSTLIPHQDAASPDSALPGPRLSERDAQRATLHDLVALATECAATESEIERRYRSEVEEEHKTFKRLEFEARNKFSNAREAVARAHKEAEASAESAYQQTADGLKSEDEQTRRKLDSRHDLTLDEVKEKHDQAVWLADSVLENAQNGISLDFKKAKEAVESHLKTLDELAARSGKLLQTYKSNVADLDQAEPTLQKDPEPDQAPAAYESRLALAESKLARLGELMLPRLFVGITPALIVFLLCVGAGFGAFAMNTAQPQWQWIGAAAGGALVACFVVGILLRDVARRVVRDNYVPLRDALASARRAAAAELRFAQQARDSRLERAMRHRKAEVHSARDRYAPYLAEATRKQEAALQTIVAEYNQRLSEIAAAREGALAAARDAERAGLEDVRQREARETQRIAERHSTRLKQSRQRYDEGRAALARRLTTGLRQIQVPVDGGGDAMPIDWNDPAWKNFKSPTRFPGTVRFGEFRIDLRHIADAARQTSPTPPPGQPGNGSAPRDAQGAKENGNGSTTAPPPAGGPSPHLQFPPAFSVPASLAFPRQGSLLIQSDRDGRADAIRVLQMVMARLLTSLPPGRVRFNIIDPIGRGENFAGFMHLADHDDALVGGRILTEQDQIDQRLADLTEHMETVIQKYLRNEYETIDEYNAQAGELAEPYRILVIADFPTGFEGESAKRLASIASSGARCGVYTLVLRDTRQPLPTGTHLDELERNSVNLAREADRFVWQDDVFGLFPLSIDPAPNEEVLTRLLDVVGRAAKAAKRVELPFDTIAPEPRQFWSQSAGEELQVPIGRMGATKLQYLRLGRGVAQHVLIAGKTGSGKSTLLHAMVTNLAMWYGPDEVEFYLVDFKKGVEFKTYATHNLPHARAIAVESDREFGLSVLQRLDGELTRRGNLFRQAGTQDLAAYRQSPGAARLPRTLLMIDEFQEFFSEDDKLAQEASVLLDRLVRQGRAFGIHVMLGSQTIGGTSGLSRSTLGQMAVRIALMTSEADSQLILGDNNSAARLLSRPGEAIYNDAGGLVEGNSPFQVAWLPDDKREAYLDRVQQRAAHDGANGHDPMIVFEGNAAADISKNSRLMEMLNAPARGAAPAAALAWLGDPVAIKAPSAIAFRRQAGANALIVGQQDESAMAIMAIAMISLAAQHAPDKAIFYVFDGSPADSKLAGVFARVKEGLPHETKLIEWRATPEAINEIATEVQRRQAQTDASAPAIYVLIYGMQRYRALRKQEESFSFGSGDEEKAPQPDKQFSDILREGPALGVHVITWADTPATLERTLDRGSMREFDHRVLFQMSANDSSNLIDSPAANKLGPNRALSYSEEQGTTEKFRPYAIPGDDFLSRVKNSFGHRSLQ